MGRVTGKVGLVTGAAVGIGKATAELLAREGAKVVLSDVKEEEGEAAAEGIRTKGGEAIFLRQDVSLETDWQEAIGLVLKSFGHLDIVVNNAGVANGGSVEKVTLEHWRRLMAVNLDGVFLGTKHAIIAMKGRGGSIINLSSIEGMIADPDLAAYNASKGGVRLLTKSAALHCARSKYNIRVNSVHPGFTWTPMVSGYALRTGQPEVARQRLIDLHPIGRLGEPDDIAYGILYLASDESKFMTGSELVIDGGYTAQ
jgi:NAD(P)-dependent dehydrogenase (short-subunit alcohol dehydrogenase family)